MRGEGAELTDMSDVVLSSAPGYAGDVTPQAAWEALAKDSSARLVDVRTQPEWSFVGVPDLGRIAKKVSLASSGPERTSRPTPVRSLTKASTSSPLK